MDNGERSPYQVALDVDVEGGTHDSHEAKTYDYTDIYEQHLDLRLRYPGVRLLWSGDWGTLTEPVLRHVDPCTPQLPQSRRRGGRDCCSRAVICSAASCAGPGPRR